MLLAVFFSNSFQNKRLCKAFIYTAATIGAVAVPAKFHSSILQYPQLKNIVIVSMDVNFP